MSLVIPPKSPNLLISPQSYSAQHFDQLLRELRVYFNTIDNYLSQVKLDASNTYTPTLTMVANLSAVTAYECQFLRVGRVVWVAGRVDADPIAGAAATQLGVSLPVSATFSAASECAGTAASPTVAAQPAAIYADTVNSRAQIEWLAVDVSNQPMYFTFSYQLIE